MFHKLGKFTGDSLNEIPHTEDRKKMNQEASHIDG